MQYIYLDQNKWIEISNAYHSIKANPAVRVIFDTCLQAVRADLVRFPLSMVHFFETLKTPEIAQRTRLAEVMLMLSDRVTIAPQPNITEQEIEASLVRLFAPSQPSPAVSVFGIGTTHATHFTSPVASQLNSRPQMLSFLRAPNEQLRQQVVRDSEETALRLTAALEEARKAMKADPSTDLAAIHRIYLAYELAYRENHLDQFLAGLGLSLDGLLELEAPKLAQFIESVPTLDVQIQLSAQRDINWNRPVRPNDYPDVIALSVAIPYCDAVVTERMWRELAIRKRLDTKYNCVILSDLAALKSYVESLGV